MTKYTGITWNGQRRNGWSLPEMIIVMAVASVIAGVSVPIVTRMWQGSREQKSEFGWERSVQRLGEQWRDDIELADRIDSSARSVELSLNQGNRIVRYTLNRGEIVRQEESGDNRSVEGYSFPVATEMKCQADANPRLQRLRLEIPRFRHVRRPQPSVNQRAYVVIEFAAAMKQRSDDTSEGPANGGRQP